MVKNNVTRLLEQRKIAYTACELPAEKLGALEAAQFLGVEPGLVYKTIVVLRERGKPVLALVSGDQEVDLKALARAVGEKKLHLPTEKQAEALTGLQAGGISALALLNKGFEVVLDASARGHSQIYVSGGQRGLDIRLGVEDFIALTNALVTEIGVR